VIGVSNHKARLEVVRELRDAITRDWPYRPYGMISLEERRLVDILDEILEGDLEKARQMIRKQFYRPTEAFIAALFERARRNE